MKTFRKGSVYSSVLILTIIFSSTLFLRCSDHNHKHKKCDTADCKMDCDSDGMPNCWESQYGLNPSANDAGADNDGDGLTNIEEYQNHTVPTSPDTDGDGLKDKQELIPDHCGTITDPTNPDTDGDGVADGMDNLPRNPDASIDADKDCYGANDSRPAMNDCNDNDASVHPGVSEICNDGKDNNCDGLTDKQGVDKDNDGSDACEDCDDSDATRHPGAIELCPNVDGGGIDQNCDGSLICTGTVDVDGDEYGSIGSGGNDCNDNDASIHPFATEVCPPAGKNLDENCDGSFICDSGAIDNDGDNYASKASGGTDCDDNDLQSYPGAPELCDGKDNNCNGTSADELVDNDGDGYSVCGATPDCDDDKSNDPLGCPTSKANCTSSTSKCAICIYPGASEVCDGNAFDNNCSGTADEGCDDDNDNYCDKNMPINGTPETCTAGGNDCNDTDPNVHPSANETCNGKDDNCDSKTDYLTSIGDLDSSCGTDTTCRDYFCNEGVGC